MIQGGIEAFLAVVRTGGLSSAAQSLFLTQPTISKRLKLLEEEIGVSLFERRRGSKDVTLTPEGKNFFDIAERWDVIYKEVENLSSMAGKIALHVGSISSINFEGAHELFRVLMRHDSQLCLKITTAPSAVLYTRVEQRLIDVALVRSEHSLPNVVVRKIYSSPIIGLCLASSPLANRENVHPHELKPEDEIFARVDAAYQVWHDTWWPAFCPQRIEIDSIHLVMELMCAPRYWALVPSRVGKLASANGPFSTFTLEHKAPERTCYRIAHKHPKKSALPGLEIFDACLAQAIAAHATKQS